MSHRKVVQEYYCDINNLADLLSKLVNSYRLLIGGAGELNNIGLAHRNDIKQAIRRANELGCVIDNLIDVLDSTCICYINYCKVKTEVLGYKIQADYILTEIDKELDFNNNERRVEDDNNERQVEE